MPRRNQVIAVVIKQYGTGLYRTCVSLDKDNVTFLSTHKDERSANETISKFWKAYDEGALRTPEDVAVFINSIHPRTAPPTQNTPVPPPTPAMPNGQLFLPLAA